MNDPQINPQTKSQADLPVGATTQPHVPASPQAPQVFEDHLSPDQFAAFALAGCPDSAAVHAVEVDLEAGIDASALAHLAACSLCREDLARFSESMSSFNTLSLAWAESRPARSFSLPATLLDRLSASFTNPANASWLPRASWALATCLMAFAIFLSSTHLTPHEPSIAALEQESDSEAQIDRDNRLMNQISVEINRPVSSPVSEYGITLQSAGTAKPHPQRTRPESRVE